MLLDIVIMVVVEDLICILIQFLLVHVFYMMDYIKGKQTKHNKKGATRSSELLEIIHTDIFGPFSIPCFNGERYFITFIDDLSRYGYVYLIHEKSQAVDILEVYVTEVERQLDR